MWKSMIRMELLHAFFFDYCSRLDALPGASGCRGRLFILAFSPYAGFFSFFPCFPKHHCISGKLCASSLPSFPVFRKIIVFQENQELLLFLFSLFSGKSLYFREIMCFFSSFFPCFLTNHGVSGKSRGAHQCFGTRESSFSCFSPYVSFSGVSDCGKKLLFRNCSVPEQLRSHRQCAPRIPNCLWLGMPAFVLRHLQRGASGCAE